MIVSKKTMLHNWKYHTKSLKPNAISNVGSFFFFSNGDSNDYENSHIVEDVVNSGIISSESVNNWNKKVHNKERNKTDDIDSENESVDVVNSNSSDENGDFEVHTTCFFTWLRIFQLLWLTFILFSSVLYQNII